jgi:hypothetical protein
MEAVIFIYGGGQEMPASINPFLDTGILQGPPPKMLAQLGAQAKVHIYSPIELYINQT